MLQASLVIIKPDGLVKSLTGNILTTLSETKLKIVGAKMVKVSKELAEKHYKHHKGKPFYDELIRYIMGEYHTDRVMALVYYGKDAIEKIREIVGHKNPEEADTVSIRGKYGRITTKGVYENVIHASDTAEEAEREIKLWFRPDELTTKIYPTKIINLKKTEHVWKSEVED
jgi:nucleoside-diphosphate kinase